MSDSFSGDKYLRKIIPAKGSRIDVYSVIDAFEVTCPARAHAIKKLLCSGIRDKGDVMQDLEEARDAVTMAIHRQDCRDNGLYMDVAYPEPVKVANKKLRDHLLP